MTASPETASNRRRRLVVNVTGAGTLLLVAAAMWNWQPGGAPGTPGARAPEPGSARRDPAGRFLPQLPAEGQGPGPTSTSTTTSTTTTTTTDGPVTLPRDAGGGLSGSRVADAMTAWRIAILNKSSDQVEALDRAFAEHRAAFIPALMESAGGDAEPRVRAFSTRVLGKLRATESRALMHRLLGDASEYVRFNAAWVIGELADREAMADLERLERRDRSEMVRRSAHESLRRLNGG
jgi:hypothetical protein